MIGNRGSGRLSSLKFRLQAAAVGGTLSLLLVGSATPALATICDAPAGYTGYGAAIVGSAGNNTINGTAGNDLICG